MERERFKEELTRAENRIATVELGQMVIEENIKAVTRQLHKLRSDYEALRISMETMKGQHEIELKASIDATRNEATAVYADQKNKLENFFFREGWRLAMKQMGVAESSKLFSRVPLPNPKIFIPPKLDNL
ncbi:hypothetical protein HYC85_015655 [Camellia sinensis]|uniref:Uncharacterized protein n=1 Tax=Camellia sinensis TaxID=4442 RepID=A0A7J7GYH6_CAMSI|nr:hypothetical protein HYC85_015655 [Camellia sinensis]